jgi:hypothetical protein
MLTLSVQIIPDHLCMRFCDLNYKPMTIVNDNYRVVNKLDASLTDDARVVIYDCYMFIVQATGFIDTCSINLHYLYLLGVQARKSALKADAQLTHGLHFNSQSQIRSFKILNLFFIKNLLHFILLHFNQLHQPTQCYCKECLVLSDHL